MSYKKLVGKFWKGFLEYTGFFNTNLGIHTLENMGKDFANEFGFEDFEKYTSYCS